MKPFMRPQKIEPQRITFMGCPMDAITMQETLSLIEQAMSEKTQLQHVVVNVAKLVHMQTDATLREDVMGSDLINIDGAGVVLGARLCGHTVPERVAGADLMQELLSVCAAKAYKPYILGAKEEVLQRAVANIQARHPQLVFAGYRNGYFGATEEPLIMQAIADSGADCLFLAITSPTKERLMAQYKDMLGVPFIMGVGGTVDILAGKIKRAPRWMQKYGLEWLYRIIQEPRRMWKRYLITNSCYVWLLLKERFGRPPCGNR